MIQRNLPVTPEELLFAFQLGNAGASHQMPMESVENKEINILDEETGEIDGFRLADNPMNRFGSAIVQEFGEDEDKFYSIMNRIMALMRILSHEDKISNYLKPHHEDNDSVMVKDILFEIMADFPMSVNGEIDEDAFFVKLRELTENS